MHTNVLEREFGIFGNGRMEPCTLARSVSQCFDETSPLRVCVIGGGIAGSTIALGLCEANRLNSLVAGRENGNNTIFNTTLFETGDSLVDGPPFCHLHAGGNLYREISDDQCCTLLGQCIDVCRLFPHCMERRPTVMLVPKADTMKTPEEMIPRLELLRSRYVDLVSR